MRQSLSNYPSECSSGWPLASICSPALGSELAKSPLEEIAASASAAGKGQSLTNIKALAFRIGVKSVVSTLGHV